jgi:hypothetical protein
VPHASSSGQNNWWLRLVLVLCAGWAGLGGLRAAMLWVPGPSPLLLVDALWPILPPLVLAGLAVLISGGRVEPVSDEDLVLLAGMRAEAETLEAVLTRVGEQLQAVQLQAASGLGIEAQTLAGQVESLGVQAAAARESAESVAKVLPGLEQGVEAVRTGLAGLGEAAQGQLAAAEALLQRVAAWHKDASGRADAAMAALAGQFVRIDEASRDSTAAMAKRSYALDAAVDGVLGRVEMVMGEVDARVNAVLARIDGGLDGAGRQLTLLGDEGVRLFSQRLDALIGMSRDMEARLAGHGEVADALQARLVDGVATAEAMAGALAGLQESLAGLEGRGDSMAGQVTALAARLAGELEKCEAAVAGFGAGMAALEAGQLRLQAAASGSAEAMAGAAARLEVAEGRLAALANALAGQFAAASTSLVELETAAARATAGSQRVAEAAAARMMGLVDVVRQTEARIDEVEARFVQRERSSLAGDATRLMNGLSASVGEMAHLLQLEVPEEAWRAWLRGDRSALPAVVRPLLDLDDQRRLQRHMAHDPAFRGEALRFLDQFEGMIGRLLGDRDGDALGATMLSSDLGKLYIRLAEAAGRIV